MTNVSLKTLNGDTTTLARGPIDALGKQLQGTLVHPGDHGFDGVRRIWNGMIDRRPGLVARCLGTADVLHAVRFAREHALLTAVRGGGHNVAGNAVCDGGLMIDLSLMRAVHVDAPGRRAIAQGGATWGDFDAETQLHGLATPGGLISETGVAGLTLGGGLGWLTPSHGLACDNLVSVELVTGEGELVIASAQTHGELFWGLKGGGGNFGVATAFEFALHPVGPRLFGGMALYPMSEADAVLEGLVAFKAGADRSVGALAAFTTTPAGDPALAVVGVYNGPVSQGESAMAPLRRLGSSMVDTFGPTPYLELQRLFDAGAPKGRRYYWKSSFLDRLPADAIATITRQASARPSRHSRVFIELLGGAMGDVARDATVFDHRDARFNLLVIGAWESPDEDAENRAWVRETWQSMDDYASDGVYVNYLGTEADEGSDRVPDAYGPEKMARLKAVKRRYDPDNQFRLNQNISPS